jgi:16S rRNA (cytidine1402-2'-O)-methyltransferase
LLEDLLATCHAETRLCVACNVSLESEMIVSKRIADWRNAPAPDLHKKPTVFLLLA